MKKILFINLLIIFLINSNICQAQLTNGNFETWSIGATGFLDPDGWSTSNYAPNLPSVVQAPGHTGNACVRLKMVDDMNSINNFGGLIEFENVGSIKPIGISGFWKVNQSVSFPFVDKIYMDFLATLTGNTISTLSINSQVNIPNWTAFNYTFQYSSMAIPDFFQLSFDFATSNQTSLAGYGDIDDLTLTYTTGINDTIEAHYPAANFLPGATIDSYNLFIDILSKEQLITQVFDLHGKMFMNNSYVIPGGHKEISFNASSLATGQYIYVVTLGNQKHSFRINKL